MAFNWLDIIILGLASGLAYKGYKTGLIQQATTIIAIMLGIYMAAEQYEIFANFIQQKFQLNLQLANLISFGIIIIVVSIIVNYLGQLLEQMLNVLSLEVIDNLGGSVFGLIKAVLIIYILILLASKLATVFKLQGLQQMIKQSFLAPKFLELNPLLKEQIDKFLQEGMEGENG